MPIKKGQQLSDAHKQAIREGLRRKVDSGWKPDTTKARAMFLEKAKLKREEKKEYVSN